MRSIKIGSGAGFAGDRIDPAIHLMNSVDLDYICFECLAERTIALAQLEKLKDAKRGYNPLFEKRMREVIPLVHQKKIKVITNMGAANPTEALNVAIELCKKLSVTNLKLAAVEGDDVLTQIIGENSPEIEPIRDKLVSANAYLGVEGILNALQQGADIIITGRVADPSLFLAPLIYEFNWPMDDYTALGKGTMVGHLLECAAQITGGYFADGNQKQVPELWKVGFPYAEVFENGDGYIAKAPNSGGLLNKMTCTEQLLYEIEDPSAYITPDCVANFAGVEFEEVEKNQVSFKGASGKPPTPTYKTSLGFRNGFLGEAQISYGGSNAMAQAQLAISILKRRFEGQQISDVNYELIGLNSISPTTADTELNEIRLRVVAKTASFETAKCIGEEVEALYTNGPAAGGGVQKKVEELISIEAYYIAKKNIVPTVKMVSL